MFLQVTDGLAKLATHKINVTLDSQNGALANQLTPYQKEDFGLVAYSVEEKDAILGVLSSFTLTSTVEDLSYTANVLSKVQSKNYNTRTEALNDLLKIVNRTLDDIKQEKISELNQSCNTSILAGFSSSALGATPHTYDFNYEAQINLGGMISAITAGMAPATITWKTVDSGNLPHSQAQFKQVFADGLTFKNNQISKYWSLKVKVLAAIDEASINAILWT